jgi:hypothetical protein
MPLAFDGLGCDGVAQASDVLKPPLWRSVTMVVNIRIAREIQPAQFSCRRGMVGSSRRTRRRYTAIAAASVVGAIGALASGELESTVFETSFGEGFDVGNVLPAGLTAAQLAGDLSLYYSISGGGVEQAAGVMVLEPGAVGVVALGVGAAIGRRRRRRKIQSRGS